MSRRHKEEIEITYKPQAVGSQEDFHLETSSEAPKDIYSVLSGLTVTKRDGTKSLFSLEKITNAIVNAFKQDVIEVDRDWVKISRSYLEKFCLQHELGHIDVDRYESVEEDKPRKGRKFLKRLFDKVSDSKMVGFFRETFHEVKEKACELYEDMKQYCGCFLKGSHQAFAPDDDPYGKVSHYHRMLEKEIPDCPSRKLINNWLKWFNDWRPRVCGKETPREKKERYRHWVAEQLIEWIKKHLIEVAPEFAVCTA